MKILMFGWEFPPFISGGLGTACHGLLKGLGQLGGTDISFVLPQQFRGVHPAFVQLISLPDAAMARPRNPGAYDSGLMPDVMSYASRAGKLLAHYRDFDIIHVHDWLTALAGIQAKQCSGRPLILHVHSTEFDRAGKQGNPDIEAIERRAVEHADRVIAVSNYTRDVLIEHYQADPAKIVTIHNGTEQRAAPSRRPARTDQATVTFLGRITRQKGPSYFIEAARLALQQRPDLRFIMAGDGDLLPQMKELASRYGLAERMRFPGFLQQDEVRHVLEHSDAYVMPSVSEPFGLTALEAVAAGVPAILSRQSGVVEVLKHVIKVDYWDTSAMAEAMLRIVSDRAYADTLRSHALRELEQVQWTHAAATVRSTYRELAAMAQSA
jgi:glycogen(starch) synthase